jgi:hypothetical protein
MVLLSALLLLLTALVPTTAQAEQNGAKEADENPSRDPEMSIFQSPSFTRMADQWWQ